LLSTTTISEERFRRYELEHTDGRMDGDNSDTMLPQIFFREHKNRAVCYIDKILTVWT
jgi:hypothetical protein